MERFANWFMRCRYLIAGGVAAVSLIAGLGASRLEFDDKLRNLLESDDADYRYLESVLEDFGSDDNDCVFLMRSADVFSSSSLNALHDLDSELRGLNSVAAVEGMRQVILLDDEGAPRPLLPPPGADQHERLDAKRIALAHPLAAGHLLSSDATTTLVIARLAGDSLASEEMRPTIARLHEIGRRVAAEHDVEILLTGIPVVRVEIYETIRRGQMIYAPLGALLGVLIAIVIFRRTAAVMIVVTASLLGAHWAMGAIGLVGGNINVINHVISTLVLVVGFTDAVHLMHDFRLGRERGLPSLDAASHTLRHLSGPCLLTSLTTAVGFGSLAFAQLGVIRRFGLESAMGVALALIAVLSLVPLLCGSRIGLHTNRLSSANRAKRLDRRLALVADWIVHHARAIALLACVVTVGLGWVSLHLRPNNQLTESIPYTSDSRRAVRIADDTFGGILFIQVIIDWDIEGELVFAEVLDAIRGVDRLLDSEPQITNPASILDVLSLLPDNAGSLQERAALLSMLPDSPAARFLRMDRGRARVLAHIRDEGGIVYTPVFDRVEAGLADLEIQHPGVSLHLTGTPVIATRNLSRMIRDLAVSLGLAVIVIFGVLALALRSMRLALVSLIPNIFPLALTGAALVAVGMPLQISSVIVFSVCLGLAVDDTIHFLSRFQRTLLTRPDVRQAIRDTFVHMAPVLLTTTIVFLGSFGIVATSGIPVLRSFALLSCIAIAAALVGDLLFLPALLAVFVRTPATERRSA